MGGGLIIAAPASGSGKTTVTLGLVRALRDAGLRAGVAKVGPDYIDAAFLSAAAGDDCINLDTWAMGTDRVARAAHRLQAANDVVVCEGVMGLFDGANVGRPEKIAPGSTAAVAVATGWPVVLVVDTRRQAGSVGALVQGFARYDAAVPLAGVVFNRVASDKHADTVRQAAALAADVPVLGCIRRDGSLALPSRHLGLVQAGETTGLEAFLARAGDVVAQQIDLGAVRNLAQPAAPATVPRPPIPPIGQRIAVARDDAFSFCYPAVVDGWRQAGATVEAFSPLNNEAPGEDADGVYLPGGYPEIHAERLADNAAFLAGLRAAAARGAAVWGECGGYMVMGDRLQDAAGDWHRMAGLLPLTTSMTEGRLHLGYREARLATDSPIGDAGQVFRGHEFHHARVVEEGPGTPWAEVQNAGGEALGTAGLVAGRVAGSFVHLIQQQAAS